MHYTNKRTNINALMTIAISVVNNEIDSLTTLAEAFSENRERCNALQRDKSELKHAVSVMERYITDDRWFYTIVPIPRDEYGIRYSPMDKEYILHFTVILATDLLAQVRDDLILH